MGNKSDGRVRVQRGVRPAFVTSRAVGRGGIRARKPTRRAAGTSARAQVAPHFRRMRQRPRSSTRRWWWPRCWPRPRAAPAPPPSAPQPPPRVTGLSRRGPTGRPRPLPPTTVPPPPSTRGGRPSGGHWNGPVRGRRGLPVAGRRRVIRPRCPHRPRAQPPTFAALAMPPAPLSCRTISSPAGGRGEQCPSESLHAPPVRCSDGFGVLLPPREPASERCDAILNVLREQTRIQILDARGQVPPHREVPFGTVWTGPHRVQDGHSRAVVVVVDRVREPLDRTPHQWVAEVDPEGGEPAVVFGPGARLG